MSLTQGDSGTKVGYVCRYEEREDYSGGHAYRYNLVVFTRSGETEHGGELVGGARQDRRRRRPRPP